MQSLNKIHQGNAVDILSKFPDNFIDCCITSPPYWGLRDYGITGQLGLERSPESYVQRLVMVFRQVRRVLKDEGTLWLNLGDSYFNAPSGARDAERWPKQSANDHRPQKKMLPIEGLKQKDLVGIPWMVAFALRADGWFLRQDIIWAKPNPMPESVTDRCTKSHEYIFLFSKSQKYFFDHTAIQEEANYDGRHATFNKGSKKYANGFVPNQSAQSGSVSGHERWQRGEDGEYLRNKRSVWTVATKPFSGAHFATFPEELILPMILSGCPRKGIVLDPFMGAGTTALVAKKNGLSYIGCELNQKYIDIAERRISQEYLFS